MKKMVIVLIVFSLLYINSALAAGCDPCYRLYSENPNLGKCLQECRSSKGICYDYEYGAVTGGGSGALDQCRSFLWSWLSGFDIIRYNCNEGGEIVASKEACELGCTGSNPGKCKILNNGEACSADSQCLSGNCEESNKGTICCAESCGSFTSTLGSNWPEYCKPDGSSCAAFEGGICTNNNDCLSGYCKPEQGTNKKVCCEGDCNACNSAGQCVGGAGCKNSGACNSNAEACNGYWCTPEGKVCQDGWKWNGVECKGSSECGNLCTWNPFESGFWQNLNKCVKSISGNKYACCEVKYGDAITTDWCEVTEIK